jgi:hypothetical protein
MIKLILQSIPSYIMSVYFIPLAIVNDIERLLNGFWCEGGSRNKSILFVSFKCRF